MKLQEKINSKEHTCMNVYKNRLEMWNKIKVKIMNRKWASTTHELIWWIQRLTTYVLWINVLYRHFFSFVNSNNVLSCMSTNCQINTQIFNWLSCGFIGKTITSMPFLTHLIKRTIFHLYMTVYRTYLIVLLWKYNGKRLSSQILEHKTHLLPRLDCVDL